MRGVTGRGVCVETLSPGLIAVEGIGDKGRSPLGETDTQSGRSPDDGDDAGAMEVAGATVFEPRSSAGSIAAVAAASDTNVLKSSGVGEERICRAVEGDSSAESATEDGGDGLWNGLGSGDGDGLGVCEVWSWSLCVFGEAATGERAGGARQLGGDRVALL